MWVNSSAETTTYWAGVENLNVRVTHTIVLNSVQFNAVDMYGEMVDTNGNVLMEFGMDAIHRFVSRLSLTSVSDHKINNIPLSTILNAAGVDLDHPSDTDSTFPFRYSGM